MTAFNGLFGSWTMIPNFRHFYGEYISVKHIEIAYLPRSFFVSGENLKDFDALSYSTKAGNGN